MNETENSAPRSGQGLTGGSPVAPGEGGLFSAPVFLRLERKIMLSRLALLWEELWPALFWPVMVVGLFLCLAWFGVWPMLGGTGRFAGLCVMAAAFLASLIRLAGLSMPSRLAAIERLDRSNDIKHRPVGALYDTLPSSNRDAAANALWQAHLRREMARVDAVAVERPRPDRSRQDPLSFGAAMVLALVVAAVIAGPGAWQKVTLVFSPHGIAPPPRIDAWVTPPAYTGRPTIFLAIDRRSDDGSLHVPTGSVLTVRSDRGQGIAVTVNGLAATGDSEAGLGGEALAFRADLVKDGIIEVGRDGLVLRQWRIVVDPDLPPTISLEGPVQKTPNGALRLRYRSDDDYGVVQAYAEFRPVEAAQSQRSFGLNATKPRRPLVEAPEWPLGGAARGRDQPATVTRDLTEHPWAGGLASLTLVARDDIGQEGRSATIIVELPQRRFVKPLARALIEQRRLLAQDANARERVAAILDALVLDPERRVGDAKTFLALRSVYHRLTQARDDEELRGVIEAMWEVALLIEDGDLSPAERALRQAQERLEQAIERGASPEELRDIMRELRQAMRDMLRELAERALQDRREGRAQPPPTGEERVISQQDLDRLMREIESLMRQGRHKEAQELMAQLKDMLNAMRNARPQFGDEQAGGDQQLMEELGEIVREQQKLLDQTFRERQRGRRQQGGQQQRGQQRQGGQQGDQQGQEQEQGQSDNLGQLRESQQALRERLQRFLDQLRQGGHEPGPPFGQADGQMGQAEGELGQGRPGEALTPQNRALDNLRRGANQLAREMLGQGEGGQDGDPGAPQARADGRNQGDDDPLGRNNPEDPDGLGTNERNVRIPGRGEQSQRIQEILKDVRGRLADPDRSPVERDYLERLLRPF